MVTSIAAIYQRHRNPVTFSWSRAAVRFAGSQLVLKPGARVRDSELPDIAGGWMRLAGLKPTPAAIAGFSSTYGFLRYERETLADWRELIELFGHMAAPWGRPGDPRCRDMPAPGPGANAILRSTHHHARAYGERVFPRDFIPRVDDAGHETWEPRTLAGLLFLQMLDARRNFPSFRRCRWCQGWFAVGRADQNYCLPKHRSLHHYHERKS
jgi:hypothetical protein